MVVYDLSAAPGEEGSIDKIGRAARLPLGLAASSTTFQPLQLNNLCTQSLKYINGGSICSSVVGLLISSIITKNRRWRIELCADVGAGVRFGCGEGEEHLAPHSAEIGVRITSTYNNFCAIESIQVNFTALKSAALALQFSLLRFLSYATVHGGDNCNNVWNWCGLGCSSNFPLWETNIFIGRGLD